MVEFVPQDPEFESRVRASFASLTLMKTVGARLLRVSPGEIEIELPFRDDLTQHHGFLAGAILTAIVDVACGYAAMTLMPPGASVLTIAAGQHDRLVPRRRTAATPGPDRPIEELSRASRACTLACADTMMAHAGRAARSARL